MKWFRSEIHENLAYFWIEFGRKFNGNFLELHFLEFLDSAFAVFRDFLV